MGLFSNAKINIIKKVPETKQIIAAALRGLMNFKDDETEKIFIDFVVCGDDYLADIAKDYWVDAD